MKSHFERGKKKTRKKERRGMEGGESISPKNTTKLSNFFESDSPLLSGAVVPFPMLGIWSPTFLACRETLNLSNFSLSPLSISSLFSFHPLSPNEMLFPIKPS
uniref:Uncharacterized protein n=1 Tax=Cacopsylla melanoneura TaxID=428564 RepID=A0A8D8TLC6_9HEMI